MGSIRIDAVLITGPQGSGKGTQGQRLAEKLGFFFWDTGEILRDICRIDDAFAKKISAMNKGTLLSDEVILQIARERLALIPKDKGVVFDGIPRRIQQAEFLVKFLRERGQKEIVTVFLDVPRDMSIKRMLLRAKKEGRADDTPEGIETRFRSYDEMMAPTVAYLKKETRFVSVDGTPSPDEVTKAVMAALGLS
jgi:adenylate kinase